jgi:hypothetical protein
MTGHIRSDACLAFGDQPEESSLCRCCLSVCRVVQKLSTYYVRLIRSDLHFFLRETVGDHRSCRVERVGKLKERGK